MSERTDERTSGSGSDEVDLDELLDDSGGGSAGDVGGGIDDIEGEIGGVDDPGGADDVGLDDDELGVDVDALTGDPSGTTSGGTSPSGGSAAKSSSGLLSRLVPSVGIPNADEIKSSMRSFLLSLLLSFVVVLGSAGVAGSIPVLGWLPAVGVLGIFAGTFVLGLVSGEPRYPELAIAGALVTGASFAEGFFRLAIISDIGFLPFAVFGGVVGLLVAVLGHYFGRDFRKGLTRDIP